jgi:arylsulfatase
MSDPLVVHWPKGISAKGDIRHQYVHAIDIVPTILEILDLSAPATLNGVAQRPIEGVSFAHTMNDADAPTKKEAQYYELIGSRAIWMDGWKAVAEQKQGNALTEEELANQRWELYHVADDFSESENLADRYPDKLKAMVERWWLEAGKYKVLPLDSRMQLRMAERKPSTVSGGTRYVYYPGGAPHFEYTAVNVKNRSHTITAEVVVPKEGAEGVLLAHGSWFAGYSLYVKDGFLVYVHNYLGLAEYRIASSEKLPAGKQVLRFEFVRTGEHQGMGILYTNGREIGRGVIGKTIPAVIETSGEGLCCGFDSGLPVTTDYCAPFRFTGTLFRVVVEIEEDKKGGPSDAEANLIAALIDQ